MRATRCVLAVFALSSAVACGARTAADLGATGAGASSSTSSFASAASTVASSSTSSAGGASCVDSISGAGGAALPHAHVTAYVQFAPGHPAPDEPIVVNDASGAIVSTTTTGSDGKVEVDVPQGGLVAAYPLSTALGMQAVVDPPDGSTITFQDPKTFSPAETTFHVTATGYPPSTKRISLLTCGYQQDVVADPSGTTTADIKDDKPFCPGLGQYRVIVFARDASWNPIAWGQAKDIAESPGDTVPVAVNVDQTSFVTTTQAIQNIDASATSANAYSTHAGPEPVEFTGCCTGGETMMPGASVSWPYPVADVGLQIIAVESVDYQEPGYQRNVSRSDLVTIPASVTLDATALAAAHPAPVDVSNPKHPQATWSAGPGSQGIATQVFLLGYQPFIITFASGTRTSVHIPDVPCSISNYQLPPDDSIGWKLTVTFLDETGATSWADYSMFHSLASKGSMASSGFVE